MAKDDEKPTRTSEGRFAPGHSGNPNGRPMGSRHKASLAVENMMEGEAESLARTTIEKAHKGDVRALKICLDRIAPRRRDRPVAFQLPPITSVEDAEKASSSLLAAVADGELSASEAAPIMSLLVSHRRLAKIEQGLNKRR